MTAEEDWMKVAVDSGGDQRERIEGGGLVEGHGGGSEVGGNHRRGHRPMTIMTMVAWGATSLWLCSGDSGGEGGQ